MSTLDVPKAPSQVTARPTGETTVEVSWDAPWFAGTSPLSGYEVAVSDDTGASRICSSPGDRTTLAVTGLTNGRSYVFTVVARNAQGASSPAPPSPPVVMDFSAVKAAKGAIGYAGARVWRSLRSSLSAQGPSGESIKMRREHYHEAAQQAGDDYEPLRSSHSDEDSRWVPPTDL